MTAAESFERYCAERNLSPGDEPAALADWLAQETGDLVLGGPLGEAPEFVAVPDAPTG